MACKHCALHISTHNGCAVCACRILTSGSAETASGSTQDAQQPAQQASDLAERLSSQGLPAEQVSDLSNQHNSQGLPAEQAQQPSASASEDGAQPREQIGRPWRDSVQAGAVSARAAEAAVPQHVDRDTQASPDLACELLTLASRQIARPKLCM